MQQFESCLLLILVLALTVSTETGWAQAPGTIVTVAGGGMGDGGLATQTSLTGPTAVFVDWGGNLYIADSGNHRIRKVDGDGIITTVAGSGESGFSGDGGLATQASLRLSDHTAVFVDGGGNLYIADSENHRIRKVDGEGIITTVAGSGESGFSGDGGLATEAKLNRPTAVFVDGGGNLYIADWVNHRVRKVDTNGIITTVAGTGIRAFGGDGGPATQASLAYPTGVFVDRRGNLYIADWVNHRIRKVDINGIITTVAGSGPIWHYSQGRFVGDGGLATQASLVYPTGVFVDGGGNLYIADSGNHRIRKVDGEGIITTVAGNGSTHFFGDGGLATEAGLFVAKDVFVNGSGNLYIVDLGNHRIRKVDGEGIITTVAGNGIRAFDGDGGAATQTSLASPTGIFVDRRGSLYIADLSNYRIRKVDTDGIITTVAGTGEAGFSGDGGPATQASLVPTGIFVDGVGNLYIADWGNHRIRKVDTNGIITTVAGTGEAGFSGDEGLATQAKLNYPKDVFIDGMGNLYIADSWNHRIRKVDTNGIITTVAGSGPTGYGEWSFSGDGGPGTQARLALPADVFVDGIGNLYIADWGNHRIRKVDTNGIITTVAGTGEAGFSGDGGLATQARLELPSGVFVDGDGNLYIADTYNHRIRKVIGVVALSTQTLQVDTNTLTFDLIDGTQASITFQSGAVTSHTVTLQCFGTEPPIEARAVPPFDTPLLYFSLNTTIPDTVNFAAQVTLTYTDTQLTEAGITDESSLTAARFNKADSTWNFVQTTSDTAANRAVFETDHFSVWALASVTPTGIDASTLSQGTPEAFILSQNYPNPFNPETTIRYSLPEASHVRLVIYNTVGQVIRVLEDTDKGVGYHHVVWDGRDDSGRSVASGVYLYRLTAGHFNQTRRMILLR